MRKFKRFPSRGLWFRSLLILAGVFALLAAFTPRANAQFLIRFYDMEGAPTAPYPVNLESHAPAVEIGAATTLTLRGTDPPGAAYPVANTSAEAGLPFCLPPNPPPNLTSLGMHRSGQTNLNVVIPMPSAQGIYDVTSICFAYGANGNGFAFMQVQISSSGGIPGSFVTIPGTLTALPSGPGFQVIIAIPPGTTLNIVNLALQLNFFGGQSNGADLQFELDNIQINGNIIPEPATVAGGLLGVLGLCWHQRRRLIRSVCLRRT
jgi:hypothetical protein